jgi:hypothetical protein
MEKEIQDILKKKAKMLVIISLSVIMDVIPIILIMAGIWIINYFSKLFGFEDLAFFKILATFSEMFMIILYVILAIASIYSVYKLFKEGVV